MNTHDNMGPAERDRICRWLRAADRQLGIACDADTPDEIRDNAADVAIRACWQAIAQFPEHVRLNGTAWAAEFHVLEEAAPLQDTPEAEPVCDND
jgi:hypothetical protein